MYNSTRNLTSNLRQPSGGNANSTSSGQSPVLIARINEKKAELENLKQLRDLSAGLAGQMSMLEEKLATLSDGTEAIATVLGNWHNVIRAISMASMKMPKPKDTDEDESRDEVPLPQTLVRITTEQAPLLQEQVGNADGGGT